MFSGIVETTGKISQITQQNQILRYQITAPEILSDIHLGDSIAVNGVCLTVVAFDDTSFSVEIVPETKRRTNLGSLILAREVNLERSITAAQRIGGHFVQGHVEATAIIQSIQTEGDAWLLTANLPDTLQAYVVPKGYISLDGMSLTVIDCTETTLTFTLIPHTRAVTIAKFYQVGSVVNVETDMMGKYLVKMMEARYAIS